MKKPAFEHYSSYSPYQKNDLPLDDDMLLSKNKGWLQSTTNHSHRGTKIGALRPTRLLLLLNVVLTIQAIHPFQNY